MPNGYVLI